LDEPEAISFELKRRSIHHSPTVSTDLLEHRIREFDRDLYRILLSKYRSATIPFSQVLAEHFADYHRPFFDGKDWSKADYVQTQKIYFDLIASKLRQILKPNMTVVDLGAGTGELSRFLSSSFQATKWLCLDKMKNAIELIHTIGSRENNPSIVAAQYDFDNEFSFSDSDFFLLTSYSLMYIDSSRSFFHSLFSRNPSGGLFLEPIFLDLDLTSPFAGHRQNYFETNFYNKTWFEDFKKVLAEQQKYTIVEHQKLFFAHNSLLPISAVLRKRNF
jgi:cyclopropane fatty-acyl-phospholipid synthase-like methyltransferase